MWRPPCRKSRSLGQSSFAPPVQADVSLWDRLPPPHESPCSRAPCLEAIPLRALLLQEKSYTLSVASGPAPALQPGMTTRLLIGPPGTFERGAMSYPAPSVASRSCRAVFVVFPPRSVRLVDRSATHRIPYQAQISCVDDISAEAVKGSSLELLPPTKSSFGGCGCCMLWIVLARCTRRRTLGRTLEHSAC